MNKSKIKKHHKIEEQLLTNYRITREEHEIKVKEYGVTVRVQVIGNGKPVLFVHGGPNAGSSWLELTSFLQDFKCIVVDRPGSGLSEAVKYSSISRETLTDVFVNVADAIMEYFKLQKIAVVASSFGGYLTLNYILKNSGKIEKLVLEGCPALVEKMSVPRFMQTITNPLLKWLIPNIPATKPFAKKSLKDIGHTYAFEHDKIDQSFADWYVSLMNDTDTLKNDIKIISRVLNGKKMQPEFILYDNEIEQIDTSTLFLWGKNDAFGGMEIGNRINSKMKNSEIFWFENAGHLPWLDHPKEHAQKIRQFLTT